MPGRLIDLHTHSLSSDGSDSPAQLMQTAAKAGLAAVALTDHDSLSGLEEASAEADRLGLEFIPGLEIAVRDEFDELHLLGLWMPSPSPRMRAALENMRDKRRARNQAMLDQLRKLGMPLDMDEVRGFSGGCAVGRPHIALAMMARGYVQDRRQAFNRYLGWGAKAFIPRDLPSPAQGIALLCGEGATVTLAHPFLAPHMTQERLNDTLATFRSLGLSAIEAYHSVHNQSQTRSCVDLAARHNLLLSGGSDYHGRNKEGIRIGTGAGSLRVPYSLLEKLRAHRKNLGLWV